MAIKTTLIAPGVTTVAGVSGRCHCVAFTGILCRIVGRQWLAGDGIYVIARSRGLDTEQVEAALRFEFRRRTGLKIRPPEREEQG